MSCTKDIENWLEEDCFKRFYHNNQSKQIQRKQLCILNEQENNAIINFFIVTRNAKEAF